MIIINKFLIRVYMYFILVCLLVFIILCYVAYSYYYGQTQHQCGCNVKRAMTEGFGDEISVKQTHEIIDLSKQFTDMIVFDNDADGRIGFDKCIEQCNGYCVEQGQTGSANCFPAREPEIKDFDGGIVPNEKQLSYPNIRT